MKRLGSILVLIVLSILVSFGIFHLVYGYYNNIVVQAYKNNLKAHTVTRNVREYQDTSQETESSSSIEMLDSNQKVKEVNSYTDVIVIPRLKIKACINEGVDRDALSDGVGHYSNTPWVGSKGNSVLAGHSSDLYDCILDGLNEIKMFDRIETYDHNGNKHIYYVINIKVVDPYDFSIFDLLSDRYNQLTLFTCTDKGTKRFVVFAFEMTDTQFEDYKYRYNLDKYKALVQINEEYKLEDVLGNFDLKGGI